MKKIIKSITFWILLFFLSPIILFYTGSFIYSIISCSYCPPASNYCSYEIVNSIFFFVIFIVLIINVLIHLFIFIKCLRRNINILDKIIVFLNLIFSIVFLIYISVFVNILSATFIHSG